MSTKKRLLTPQEKIDKIAPHFKIIMETLGLDTKSPAIKDTPRRVAKMYVNEICAGLHNAPPKITVFPNKQYDQMLIEKNITLTSLCEHHWMPIHGRCHIAYIPGKEVIGLSKLIRVAQHFAAKPQIQEGLTEEIAEFLKKTLETENVAVVIEAAHYCCIQRGVKDVNSTTITSHLGGVFKEPAVRTELFNFIK